MSKSVKFLGIAVLACALTSWCACAEIEADIVSINSPNLLVNPGFEEVNAAGGPAGWVFANMANSNKISAGVRSEDSIGKYSAFVVTPGNLPGYWTQAKAVPVAENATYFGSAKFKSNGPNTLLWIQTEQWDDGKCALAPPWSQTVIFSWCNGAQGSALRDTLGLFIDPKLIKTVSEDAWTTHTMEFTVPAGHGIKDYIIRTGAYFGRGGYLMIDDVYFGLARRQMKITIKGADLVKAEVKTQSGESAVSKILDPKLSTQIWEFELPSSKTVYVLKVTTVNNQTWMKEF